MERWVREAPLEPGVYIMRNKSGKVIYVGKARSLRNRIKWYFSPTRRSEAKDALVRS
ncbi:MAG: GIY-YIG nuclease family protein, partial [Candidatus Freyarchaeota archaeon]